jgi:CheY-like chemotaxis protein
MALGAGLAFAPLIPVFCPEGREGEKPLFLPPRLLARILVTDVQMPSSMNGLELTRSIRAAKPQIQ